MKYYKDDGEISIDGRKAVDIPLQVALQEVDNLPAEDVYDGNFIGFTNEKGETIQFIRREQESWFMDVPVRENGKIHSLHETDLITEKVQDVVKKFFLGEDWRSLCNLKK